MVKNNFEIDVKVKCIEEDISQAQFGTSRSALPLRMSAACSTSRKASSTRPLSVCSTSLATISPYPDCYNVYQVLYFKNRR